MVRDRAPLTLRAIRAAIAHTAAGICRLERLLLKERIVLSEVCHPSPTHDAKRPDGALDVTKLIVAQMLYLAFGQSREANLFLISTQPGRRVGTPADAIGV